MIDRNKIIKALITLAAVFIAVIGISKLVGANSLSLTEYAQQNPIIHEPTEESIFETDSLGNETAENNSESLVAETTNAEDSTTEILQNKDTEDTIPTFPTVSTLTGAILNAGISEDERVSYTKSFYYEPLSDNLRRYITGISYPSLFGEEHEIGEVSTDSDMASNADIEDKEALESSTENNLAISYEDLRYVHILHYDFDGNLAEGELICHEYIAQDLVEIFHELYLNEYRLERVQLIDEYNGDDTASMEDNNTSCFNYRLVAGSTSLSKHALGLAIDINPFYNPYITYNEDGSENVSPTGAEAYADRSLSFPYKIDENDLCYKLFTEHGFIWGGNWNSCKDYQHFQKTIPF